MSHTRREFLKASLAASALVPLGPALPAFLGRSALAGAGQRDGDTALVVVQLTGGNDGLNTVVPFEDDDYHRNRPTLRVVAKDVHKIDGQFGFHPRMGALAGLYKEGYVSVVHGVGYPNPTGDHAASMRHWQTGKPHQTSCQTGWLGRVVDHVYDQSESGVPAVFVGQIARPFTLNAEKAVVPSVRSLQDWTLHGTVGAGGDAAGRGELLVASNTSRSASDDELLDFVRSRTQAARAASERVKAVAEARSSDKTAELPPFEFAETLRTVAQLIRADLGIRIFYTAPGGDGFGGFDNHANQLGNHCARLHELSECLAAFAHDLKRDNLLDRVLLMTFSEFGRTVKENGRRGTDHGSAAPMLLVGGKVKAGLIGEHPNLTELENGGQKFHTDFRRVYATALDRWLGFDGQAVLGERFEPLEVLDA